MIVDAFLEVIAGAISGILNLLPTYTLPPWFNDSSNLCNGVDCPGNNSLADFSGWLGGTLASVKTWIDLSLALAILPLVLTVLVVVIGVKLVRLVLSLVSGGGGGGVST